MTNSSSCPNKLKWALFVLLVSIPICARAQSSVNYAPRLTSSIVGRPDVGVHATGSLTTSLVFSSLTKQDFTLNNSISVTSSQHDDRTTTYTMTPKPKPSPSGFLKGVTGLFKGDFSGITDWLGNGLDQAVEPNNYDWKQVYTTSTATGQQSSDTSSLVQEFQQQVQQSTSSEVKFDLNGGYIQIAIRIRNVGSAGVRVVDPKFTLYFILPGDQPVLQGSAKAYQTNPTTTESFYLGPQGNQDSVDLTFRLDNLNYQTLCQNYATASGLLLIFEDPEISKPDKSTVALQEEIDNWSPDSIHVRIVSDSYNFEAYVPAPSQGLTLADILSDLRLSPTFDTKTDNPTLALQSITPDSNVGASSDPRGLTAQDLISWRRWIILAGTPYPHSVPSPAAKLSVRIPQGGAIYLFQLTAKDILGPDYKPVVYSQKNVILDDTQEISLTGIPLQEEDRVILSNVHLNSPIKRDVVAYRTHDLMNMMYSGPIGGGQSIPVAILSTESGSSPPLPRMPQPPSLTAVIGERFIIAEPVSAGVAPVSSMQEYFQVQGASSLPDGFPLEEFLKLQFLALQLEILGPEGAPGGFQPVTSALSNVNWKDAASAAKALSNVSFIYDVTAPGNLKWIIPQRPTAYTPFAYDTRSVGLPNIFFPIFHPTLSGPTHIPFRFIYFIGQTPIWNVPNVCSVATITDPLVCARVYFFPAALFSRYGVSGSPVVGNSGLFQITADVDVLRLGGR